MRFPPSLTRHLLRRGLLLWLSLRASVALIYLFAGGSPMTTGVSVTMWIAVLTVSIGFVESRRHGEQVLFANLGVARRTHALLLAGPIVVGEILLRLVLRVLP